MSQSQSLMWASVAGPNPKDLILLHASLTSCLGFLPVTMPSLGRQILDYRGISSTVNASSSGFHTTLIPASLLSVKLEVDATKHPRTHR